MLYILRVKHSDISPAKSGEALGRPVNIRIYRSLPSESAGLD